MVGSPHEAMHRLFQHDPGVFARAFRVLDLPFGDPKEVAIYTNDLTEFRPLERRVDTLLKVTTDTDGSFLLAVEAQGRTESDKPAAWAYYVSYLTAAYNLPVVLVVVCQDHRTSRWAAGPFRLGVELWPSLTVRPLVLGPHNVPMVTDKAVALADIPLATLSAITHARDARVDEILETLAGALRVLDDEEEAHVFAELTELGLGRTRAATMWSQLMSVDLSFFRSPTSQRLRAEGRVEGLVEGRAETLLRLLRLKFGNLPKADVDRVRAGRPDQFDAWTERVLTATSLDEFFGR